MDVFDRLKEHYDKGQYHNDEIVNVLAECVFELNQEIKKLKRKKVVPKKLREEPKKKKKGLFKFG